MHLVKIALIISYDGSDYDGWQDNHENRSIEGSLKKAFYSLYHTEHLFDAASRTDKGVHALNQVVITHVNADTIALNKLRSALNSKLPSSIRIKAILPVDDSFHPSLKVAHKTYQYRLNLNKIPLPFEDKLSWHVPYLKNIDVLHAAAASLIGLKNFSSFTCRSKTKSDPICQLHAITLHHTPTNMLLIELTANKFLYKMCRVIVGTLVALGEGKLSLDDLNNLFLEHNRPLAGLTAPAKGLFLKSVYYPDFSTIDSHIQDNAHGPK